MKTTTQSGKGLTGFIIGLLLATLVIVGVLFFLNKNKTTFRQPETDNNTPSQPEILTPANSASSPPVSASETDMSASEESTENMPPENTLPEAASQATPAPATTSTRKTPAEHKSPGKPTHSTHKNSKPATADKHQSAPQTTVHPEDILNSGSLEKAEQKTRQRAKKPISTDTGNKVILQLGSYHDQTSADTQRAKLAMLGIDTIIRKATVNDKTVYRVQTSTLAYGQAQQLRKKLQQNNIDSLMRTAP